MVGELLAFLLALPQPPPPVGTSLTFGSFPLYSVRILGILTGIGILREPAELDPPCPTIELAFLALVRLAAAAAMADAVLWYVLLPGLLDITISLAFVVLLLVIAIPVEEVLELLAFPMSD